MIRIVLVEPEIPQNTGNISRTCAVTGMPLYLIRPLGFEITDANVKRAGLDYWDQLHLEYFDSFEELITSNPTVPFFLFSSKASKIYTEAEYPQDCFLVFGKETKGLPQKLISANSKRALRIPMVSEARCLNLSNAVAVVAYEALRQHGFENMR